MENASTASVIIVNRRVFNVSLEGLFALFADPAHLAQWWGPDGFSNVFETFDLRPGGAWRFTMTNDTGRSFAMDKVFLEVAAPERIALRHLSPMHLFVMTMMFAEVSEDQSELIWHFDFEADDETANLKDFIAAANEQNFDRLEAYLETLSLLADKTGAPE